VLVLNTHELGSVPRRRRAALARGRLRRSLVRREARRWERLERAATRWADTTLCVTDGDAARLRALGGERVVTVPLGMDTERIVPRFPADAPPRFVFFGSFDHRPNRVAAATLVRELWPAASDAIPAGELLLAGRGSQAFWDGLPAAVRRRAGRVRALGYVDDLGALLASCLALVAPLTEGGGIKIKILEAMARGLPVLTTPVGAEGIVAPADDAAWIVPADGAFARAMVEVAEDRATARRRAERARRLVEERYSWSAIVDRLTRIYEEGAPSTDGGAGEGAPSW
jgi:glycosyltransferase involved in cell wall biosynthesis